MHVVISQVSGRISSFVELCVASTRIEAFLSSEEVVSHHVNQRRLPKEGEIKVRQGRFRWHRASVVTPRGPEAPELPSSSIEPIEHVPKGLGKDGPGVYVQLTEELPQDGEEGRSEPPCIAEIDCGVELDVASGSLVYVIGTVASGKSSLLAAFLSEMEAGPGLELGLGGQVAYVAQVYPPLCEHHGPVGA